MSFERAEPLVVWMGQRGVLWVIARPYCMASLVIAIVAVLGLFVEIPIISDYAFWVLVGAYLIWHGVHSRPKKSFRPGTMASLVLLLVAIVGVFVEIPIVSDYAFWVLAAAYLVQLSFTSFSE
jgi:hypothetical protein